MKPLDDIIEASRDLHQIFERAQSSRSDFITISDPTASTYIPVRQQTEQLGASFAVLLAIDVYLRELPGAEVFARAVVCTHDNLQPWPTMHTSGLLQKINIFNVAKS